MTTETTAELIDRLAIQTDAANGQIEELKETADRYRISFKFAVSIIYVIFSTLVIFSIEFFSYLASTGGYTIGQQLGDTGNALLFMGYNLSAFFIDLALLIAIVVPLAIIWRTDIITVIKRAQQQVQEDRELREEGKKWRESKKPQN